MYDYWIMLYVGIYGLIGGSFATAWIYRVKEDKKIATGRSMCPECKHQLSTRDLIPLFSWLITGGKCRHCDKSINASYPLIELATATTFVISYAVLSPETIREWVSFVLLAVVLVQLIALFIYDLRWMLLPDRMMIPLSLSAIAYTSSHVEGWSDLYSHLGAAAIAFGFFYGLFYVSKGAWMGGGDVKYSPIMGLLVGIPAVFTALFLAFNTGAVVSLALIGFGIKSRKDAVPFGPFLIVATWIALLYSEKIVDLYFNYLVY